MADVYGVDNYQINVGAGDCSVHILAKNPCPNDNRGEVVHAVLVDGGNTTDRHEYINQSLRDIETMYDNASANSVAPIRFHSRVVTHWDADHYVGIIDLLESDLTAQYQKAAEVIVKKYNAWDKHPQEKAEEEPRRTVELIEVHWYSLKGEYLTTLYCPNWKFSATAKYEASQPQGRGRGRETTENTIVVFNGAPSNPDKNPLMLLNEKTGIISVIAGTYQIDAVSASRGEHGEKEPIFVPASKVVYDAINLIGRDIITGKGVKPAGASLMQPWTSIKSLKALLDEHKVAVDWTRLAFLFLHWSRQIYEKKRGGQAFIWSTWYPYWTIAPPRTSSKQGDRAAEEQADVDQLAAMEKLLIVSPFYNQENTAFRTALDDWYKAYLTALIPKGIVKDSNETVQDPQEVVQYRTPNTCEEYEKIIAARKDNESSAGYANPRAPQPATMLVLLPALMSLFREIWDTLSDISLADTATNTITVVSSIPALNLRVITSSDLKASSSSVALHIDDPLVDFLVALTTERVAFEDTLQVPAGQVTSVQDVALSKKSDFVQWMSEAIGVRMVRMSVVVDRHTSLEGSAANAIWIRPEKSLRKVIRLHSRQSEGSRMEEFVKDHLPNMTIVDVRLVALE
ncbi:Putative ribonuclease Z/Hydroxyacylglutathione hydrolase [Septoria linicola]|uniref:Ribonuclease Z/Hydroxyacylglutathione hydrolase n=1 Tax=Septoria linicola TaxID=215465 RepID=A0A9Q9ASS0_9PEZI|nr:Putative ribonuclease Z/Hydroxyacylglutathione hydrolase [Septoria linicola]